MPQPASMCSQNQARDRAEEDEMAGAQTAERRDLADLTAQIAALQEMTVGQLAERYLEVIGIPSRSRNKRYLQKRIAWQIQADADGGLSQRALDRIEQLAPLAPVRWRQPLGQVEMETMVDKSPSPASGRDPRLPAVGTVITRKHGGVEHQVTVLDDGGFEYKGERHRSLSKIARLISGTPWNGYLFFGLTTRSRSDGASA